MKKILVWISLLFLLCSPVYAADYYIDLSDSGSSNTGTWDEPYNSVTTLNALSPSAGDGYYFKDGTHNDMSVGWLFPGSGTSGSHITIGCASADGVFTCSTLPVLDGNETVPSNGTNQGLIYTSGQSYIDIENLRGEYSGSRTFMFLNSSSYITLDNCYIYRSYGNAISVTKSHDIILSNTECDDNQYNNSATGAAIEVTGGDDSNVTYRVWLENVTVHGGECEGIGIYKKPDRVMVRNCTVYDLATYYIYADAAKRVYIVGCLTYSSSSDPYGPKPQIQLNNEYARGYCYVDSGVVAFCMLANGSNALVNGCQRYGYGDTSCYFTGIRDYGNIVIDATLYNLRFWAQSTSSDIKLFNNISVIIDGGSHINTYSPNGTTFDTNYFSSTIPSGNAANNQVNGNHYLVKTSGWQDLTAGSVDKTWFTTENELSEFVDNAIKITTIATTESSDTTMEVNDVYPFFPGQWIAVDNDNDGTADFIAQLTDGLEGFDDIDYTNGIVTLTTTQNFTAGGSIWAIPDGVEPLTEAPSNAWGGLGVDLGPNELSADSPEPGTTVQMKVKINPSYKHVKRAPAYAPVIIESHME